MATVVRMAGEDQTKVRASKVAARQLARMGKAMGRSVPVLIDDLLALAAEAGWPLGEDAANNGEI
jgi:hypothetical protein